MGKMARKNTVAVAYYRTSSATGADKDSQKRQADAVECYAEHYSQLSDIRAIDTELVS